MKKFLSNIIVIKRVFVSVAVALAVIAFVPLGVLPQAAAEPPVLPSRYKPVPEGYDQTLQPNVLLLLDTSGSMTFKSDSDTSTYGDGSKPYKYNSSVYRYFGCDLDNSNNNPDTAFNYHPNLVYIDDADLTDISQGYRDAYFAKSDDNRYLYPNDSRMYKLKLALWKILNDESLISGLRLGLATYYQQSATPKVPDIGIYYQWPPTSTGSNQALSWEGSSDWDRALLRRFFRSTDEPGSVEEIKKWIDGIETSDNPELRAHGATPLAASIYGADVHPTKQEPYRGDVRDFFLMEDPSGKKENAIKGWCQYNWLIVLTDGMDTEGGDPVTAVKNLYDEQTKTIWPSFNDNKAHPVRTMVIGLINPNASGVSTLKNTLNRMADMGDDGQENSSSRGHAYFATNMDELIEAFRSTFKDIKSFNPTASAPLVSPPLRGQEGSVYVPYFVPRNEKQERQWEGHLYKYALSSEGVMAASADWDAGSELESKLYSTRDVFTVNWKDGNWKLDFKDINEDINAQALALMLGLTEDQASKFTSKFIRWALGWDEWDEVANKDERYKLGDIYHSGMVEIGPPRGSNPGVKYGDFKDANKNREKLVYVQANDGMLHAFKADTGEEKWAFIPPNVLAEGRMTGMKQNIAVSGNTTTVTWLDEAKSYPRYLLDGPMTAEDVLLSDDGNYHTVLLGLLGYAGPGLYALDVTDPDNPEFMWAVENAIYKRTGNELLQKKDAFVCYWERKGNTVTRRDKSYDKNEIPDDSDLNYKDLRFTLSTPGIGYVAIPNESQPVTWVAIMGNGSQMRINDAFSVASVYVINIENGKLLKVLKVPNLKQVVTPTAILGTGSTRLIRYFYVGDDNGNIHEGDLTADTWTINAVFQIEGSVGPSYILDAAYINRDKWLFVFTGDYEKLMKDDSEKLDYMIAANISAGAGKRTDLGNLTKGEVANENGWYMEIPGGENVTTPPIYYNGHLFFATYESQDPCSVGKSRIYVLDATTGEGAWNGDAKYVELEGVKVSGMTISEGKVYAGVTKYPQAQTTIPGDLKVGEEAAVIQESLLVFDVPPEVANGDSAYPSGAIRPSYWRRWIP